MDKDKVKRCRQVYDYVVEKERNKKSMDLNVDENNDNNDDNKRMVSKMKRRMRKEKSKKGGTN